MDLFDVLEKVGESVIKTAERIAIDANATAAAINMFSSGKKKDDDDD